MLTRGMAVRPTKPMLFYALDAASQFRGATVFHPGDALGKCRGWIPFPQKRCARFWRACMPAHANFPVAGLLGLAATRTTHPEQEMLPDPRHGCVEGCDAWRGTYRHTPVCHVRLGVLGRGTPEPETRTHKLETSNCAELLCCITDKATRGNVLGLCCDRIVELILCRCPRRVGSCHLETRNRLIRASVLCRHMVAVLLPVLL